MEHHRINSGFTTQKDQRSVDIYKLRNVEKKLNVKGRRYPKRVYDISFSDDKEYKSYDEEEDTEQHRLYFQSY